MLPSPKLQYINIFVELFWKQSNTCFILAQVCYYQNCFQVLPNPGNPSFSGQGFGSQASSVHQGYTGKICTYLKKTLPQYSFYCNKTPINKWKTFEWGRKGSKEAKWLWWDCAGTAELGQVSGPQSRECPGPGTWKETKCKTQNNNELWPLLSYALSQWPRNLSFTSRAHHLSSSLMMWYLSLYAHILTTP